MGFFSSIRKIFTGNADAGDMASASEKEQNEAQIGQLLAKEPEASVASDEPASPTDGQNDFTEPTKAGSVLDNVEYPSVQAQTTVQNATHKESPIREEPDGKEHAVASPLQKEPKQASIVTPQATPASENETLTLALRAAEPKHSAWLAVVLKGVDKSGDLLWSRLSFLLSALEAPTQEADDFIHKFKSWLDMMGYEQLDDFRSELQYRLALALDLEDEEDERSRLVMKLSEGLAKTRAQLSRNLNALFSAGRSIDAAFWEELEETLLVADVGYATASGLSEALRKKALEKGITDAGELRALLREEIISTFKPVRRISAVNPPEVILMIGVNGAGKTTTIAKLSHRAQLQGKKVMLVAGDTFRAAATEQLGVWAERTGAGFYAKGHGADPAAVAYEALDKALADGSDAVYVDTAGRLHTKTNLMEELSKIRRVLAKRHPGAPHRTILVLDATTGQNALSQVKLFNEVCEIDDIVLTKLDGTAKGGIAIAIAMQFGIPISFIGLGEKMEDLRPFDAEAFVGALLGE